MPTDVELRDQAVAKLKSTTISYPEWLRRVQNGYKGKPYPPEATAWGQAFALLAQIGVEAPPPPPPPPPPTTEWQFKAQEAQDFTLTESAEVRYGKGDVWVYKMMPAGTHACVNQVFGDPVPGVTKECWARVATTDPDPEPPPTGAGTYPSSSTYPPSVPGR